MGRGARPPKAQSLSLQTSSQAPPARTSAGTTSGGLVWALAKSEQTRSRNLNSPGAEREGL